MPVEALPFKELLVTALHIARRGIIHHGIAEYVIQRISTRYIFAGTTNNNYQLCLKINRRGHVRIIRDVVVGSIDGRGRFGEYEWEFGQLDFVAPRTLRFFSMGGVVLTQAHNIAMR
jgi:hypothetical protein